MVDGLLRFGQAPKLSLRLVQERVRSYSLVGEPEKALDKLEPLLKIPYLLSPALLKIDPTSTRCVRTPAFRGSSRASGRLPPSDSYLFAPLLLFCWEVPILR